MGRAARSIEGASGPHGQEASSTPGRRPQPRQRKSNDPLRFARPPRVLHSPGRCQDVPGVNRSCSVICSRLETPRQARADSDAPGGCSTTTVVAVRSGRH